MSHITTFTGKHFNPANPNPEDIDIRDIAHALSLICRANGHTRFFYSVGQHSISCYKEAETRGLSHRIQLGCLLHDSSEAYMSDVMRPIKSKLTEYLKIEDRLQNMIWSYFIGELLTDAEKKIIFQIDDEILSYEFIHLLPESISDDYKKITSHPILEFVNPTDVENEFICLTQKLSLLLSGMTEFSGR